MANLVPTIVDLGAERATAHGERDGGISLGDRVCLALADSLGRIPRLVPVLQTEEPCRVNWLEWSQSKPFRRSAALSRRV
jgi:hypothetical protein